MKEPFKCCWNCRLGGIRLHLSDKKQDDESAVTERLCMSLTEMQLHPGKVGPSKIRTLFVTVLNFIPDLQKSILGMK